MKMPPLLLTAALLLWGWQTDFLIWAVIMAVILEFSRFISSRLEFSNTDLNRIFDLCTLFFVGAAVILYASDETINRPFQFARWQPFVFFPMILAQVYGNREQVPLSALSLMLRGAKNHPLGKKGVNLSYPYFAICLLGASAGNTQGPWFYPAMVMVVSWALLAVKPIRFGAPIWVAIVVVAAGSGFIGQMAIHQLQASVEEVVGRWISKLFERDPDLRQSRTSIGQIGRLKLSGKIRWRLETPPGEPAPSLLREVTYDTYYGDKQGTWRATKNDLAAASLGGTNDTIYLLPKPQDFHSARLMGDLPRGKGILPLPTGSFELVELPVSLKTNSMSVALVEQGPTFLNFDIHYGSGASMDGPPTEDDLSVPGNEQEVMKRLAGELRLSSKPAHEKLETIERYFQNNFTYSIYLDSSHVDPKGKQTPLGWFLTTSHSGHCEYFATATVLLLRQAGIPARYAVGYSVQESNGGGRFIVRERHAHAWALAYLDGAWHDFDTTPASWGEIEAARASLWENVSDFFSRLGFEFSKWRWSRTSYTKYLVWVLVPLVLYMVWRIGLKTKRKQKDEGFHAGKLFSWPGLDSEFYQLERRVADFGLARRNGEPLVHWRQRLESSAMVSAEKLESILALHHRYRFDPESINGEERQQLRAQVEELLRELNQRQQLN